MSSLVLGASASSATAVPAVVSVGGNALALGALPDGSRVYVSNVNLDTVAVIDTDTNTVAKTVPVGSAAYALGVAPAGDRVYVASAFPAAVWVIDTTTDTVVATVPIGGRPIGVAVSDTSVYVVDDRNDRVQVIERSTNTVVDSIPVGGSPYGAALVPSGSTVYVGNRVGGSVSVIDTATNNVTDTVALPSGSYPYGLSATDSSVYVSDLLMNDFDVIDTATKSVTEVPAGQTTTAATVSSNGKRAFVTQRDGTVLVLDTETNSLSSTYPGRGASYGVAFTRGRLYVGNFDSGTVDVRTLSAFAPQSQSVAGVAGSAITPTAELVPTFFEDAPTFTVSPALPAGLELDAESGIISGTPTTAQAATTYTITAAQDTTSASGTVSISVSALAPASQSVAATHGQAIEPTDVLTPSGGFDGAVTYSVSPTLPAGLSLDTETGVISGTPTAAAQAVTTYTITGTGAVAGTAVASVEVSIAPALTWTDTSIQGTAGTPLTATLPPTVGGFAGTATFSVSPALPAGLSLDTATGVIGGTPASAMEAATYSVTASDGASSASRDVIIQIAGLAPVTQAVAGTHGTTISPTAPLVAVGFDGAVTYTVAPSLPTGLSLDAATGVVTGTPTGRAQAATSYTVSGSGATTGTASASISIAVAPVGPAAVTGVVANPGIEQATITWIAPTDDGGTSPVTYSVTASSGGAACITTDTSCVITGLVPGSTTFTVVASAPGGSSRGVTSGAVTIAAKPVPVADPTLTPTISGTPTEGRTLTAHATGVRGASYQWLADGRRMKGATKATLRLAKPQAGRRISVTVTSGPVTATSRSTMIVSSKRSRLVLSDYSVRRGEGFEVRATGLQAHQRIRIWLGGRRVLIGRADGRGIVDRTVTFPASVESGIRRVRVSGYDGHDVRTSTIRTTARYGARR